MKITFPLLFIFSLSKGQKISSTSLSYKLLISKGVLFTFVLFNFYLLLITSYCPKENYPEFPAEAKMKGLSFVAPPDAFAANPMLSIQQLGADWIAVIPYAYTKVGEPHVHYDSHWQWWGERPEGARKSIELAKEAGIKVMLKPQVYIPGSWPGDLDFDSDQAWESWEKDYESYIMAFAKMANELDVELFCIGTEFKISERKRTAFWRKLIRKIRNDYCGELTYATNWDHYQQTPFWDDLDYIGVNAYFPLSDEKTPSVKQLIKAWQPTKKKMQTFAKAKNRPILFTEYGYLSVDACASKTWELEKKVKSLTINEQAQANAIQALFEVFWPEPFWAGGFLWKWFPNGKGHEGYPERDYTPQGKAGERVLKKWFTPRGYKGE